MLRRAASVGTTAARVHPQALTPRRASSGASRSRAHRLAPAKGSHDFRRAHADVFDCVVVGVPDNRWGEMVVALVHPSDGRAVDADALTAHCRVTLAAYKVPKRVVLVDSLERSPAGKADYKHLREIAASRIESEV